MAAMTAVSCSFTPVCKVQRPVARRSMIVCSAQKQEQKQQVNKVAQVAAAGMAALFIASQPALADVSLKNKICATNPTSKICLRDSAKK